MTNELRGKSEELRDKDGLRIFVGFLFARKPLTS